MVAVAIQPNTSAMRAQGRTFILAILLKKVFTDKDFIMIVLQTFLGFQQRTGDYNLVEQVPLATIEQCSHAFIFKGFPPGIIEFALLHLFAYLRAPSVAMLSSMGSSFISPMTISFSFLSVRIRESVNARTCLAACTRTGDLAPREGQ